MSNSITKRIGNHFYNGRYFAAKTLIEKYLEETRDIENAKLAYIFGIVFSYTNDYDRAIKYLDLCATLTNDFDLKINIALTFRKMRQYRKAEIVLENLISDKNYHQCLGYYLLAKTEFFAGNYNYALELFETCLQLPGHEKYLSSIQNYITKSKNHLKNNTSKMDYHVFKDLVGKLVKGHIVYLKNPRISEKKDLGFYKRPYLIFDITSDTAYVLGLVAEQITPFKLPASLCNSPTDKYLLNKVTTIKLDDIESVVGQIDPKYFSEIVYHLYHSYHHYFNNSIPLVPDNLTPVSLHKVIVIYNEELKTEEYYFVCQINDEYYEAIKLNVIDGIFIPSDENKLIPKNAKFFDVITLNNDIISYLIYTINNMKVSNR